MKYIYCFIFTILLGIPAFSEIFSTSTYSMEYKNWFKTAYPTFDAMFLAPKNSTGTYHENISVLIRKYPYKGAIDWDTIKKYQVDALKKAVSDFKLISWTAVKLDNIDSRKIHYTGKWGNFKLQWIQIYSFKNNIWYVVSYMGDDDKDFSDYSKEATDIINSFKFK